MKKSVIQKLYPLPRRPSDNLIRDASIKDLNYNPEEVFLVAVTNSDYDRDVKM